MRRFVFLLLITVFLFPLITISQVIQPIGNNLFELLDKPASSTVIKMFDEFYNIEIKDNSNRRQVSKGIEYDLKNEKIKKIILHNTGSEWSSYPYELPLGLKWNMTENEVVKLLGPKVNNLPYHYDKNLDLDPKYDNDKLLSSIELKHTNYFDENAKEKDDDALLALFLDDPKNFKYLKNGSGQSEKKPVSFDKTFFKKELNDIVQVYADKRSEQLKGQFLYEIKRDVNPVKYYASLRPVSFMVNQHLEQGQIFDKLKYVMILDEIKATKTTNFPAAVLNRYNYWLGILKEAFSVPWTFEDAEVYEGIIDKGVTFENKTGQNTSGGFTYYKYPFIDIYIVYKKDHYSIELNIY